MTLDVHPPETLSFRLSDGTRLDADVWRPVGAGPWPVLLQRQAYGRRIGCTICMAHPAWYAAQGYIVVVQDIRGRGTSEGSFRPGETEAQDGFETIAWAAALPGADGQVGMYGFSYQAYVQWLAVQAAPPALRAVAPAMGPWAPGADWAYDNGALRLADVLGWGFQVGAEAARRAGDDAAMAGLAAAAASLPLGGPVPARPDLVDRHRGLSHLADWLDSPPDAAFWRPLAADGAEQVIRDRGIAVLVTAGWYDLFLPASLRAFQRIGAGHARLLVGPWGHFPWGRVTAGQDFGPAAARDMDAEHIRFFDRALKGRGDAPLTGMALFDTGRHAWAEDAALLPARLPLWLDGSGRASITPSDGRLTPAPGRPGVEHVVHDPWRPAPARAALADGAVVDARGDVATFTTAPLAAPLRLCGQAQLALRVRADQPAFDLSVALSSLAPDGRVTGLASAYAHHRSAPPGDLCRLELSACCVTLPAGSRLRLSLAGADFPAHPVNPGTGADPATAGRSAARIITLCLHRDAAPALLLPATTASFAEGPDA